jgi:hypothetical protein
MAAYVDEMNVCPVVALYGPKLFFPQKEADDAIQSISNCVVEPARSLGVAHRSVHVGRAHTLC